MPSQTVFKRYELKYMLTSTQKDKLENLMSAYMIPDKYGKTTIRNIYYDTDSYLLIRRSIEKPTYKEKLRIRSYGSSKDNDKIFVELKKKYKSVVYKRRIELPEIQATSWLNRQHCSVDKNQISQEIDYFLSFYKNLHPVIFLSYEREAYFANSDPSFRVTFDNNILFRHDNLSLNSDVYGTSILPKETYLMELKCSGGIPLWMTNFLSEEHIYKTSFSKYGTVYKNYILTKQQDNKYIIKKAI